MSEKPKETGAQLEARWRKANTIRLHEMQYPASPQHKEAMGSCAAEFATFLEGLQDLAARATQLAYRDNNVGLRLIASQLMELLGERVTGGG